MNTIYPPSVPVNAIVRQSNSMKEFKSGVDELLIRRSYFMSQVMPKLIEGQDYYVIKGRKSLAKGGSEKIASIYGYMASFQQDHEVEKSFESVKGIISFVCNLYRESTMVGQGRGASTLSKNDNDPNKTIKMAQKSAYIDAVIRTSGLSDIFTQDLDVMPISNIVDISNEYESPFIKETTEKEEPPMTSKQNILLRTLIFKVGNPDTRSDFLHQLESGLNKYEASEMISSLLPMR